MEVVDGRNKSKKRHSSDTAKVFRKRKTSKSLSGLSKEDFIQWLQKVKISELS